MTLNETVSVEAARAFARRILEEGGATDEARLDYAFRRCLSRAAAPAERAELLSLMAKERARIAEGWLDPNEIATGEKQVPADLPKNASPTQLATYTLAARVLLNLDETITKE